jgi:phosphatidylglycerol---prolipoprotein diacylglyceryl transferase
MLNYIVWNIKPQIIQFSGFEIRYYSLLFGLGFIFGYYIFTRMFKREGVDLELLDKLTLYVIVATIIGARFGHCLFYEPEVYLKHPLKIILPFEGKIGVNFKFTGYQGLASHGGAIGLLIGLYLYSRKYKVPYIWILDRIAIATALAATCIRTGNFFNSEINGIPTNLPWGVKFMQAWDGFDKAAGEVVPKHPAQLYEAFVYLLIFIFLMYFYNKKLKQVKPGFFIGWFFILVFTARFFIEFVKDIQVSREANMFLNMGQLLSIPFIILGIYLVNHKFEEKPLLPVKLKPTQNSKQKK